MKSKYFLIAVAIFLFITAIKLRSCNMPSYNSAIEPNKIKVMKHIGINNEGQNI